MSIVDQLVAYQFYDSMMEMSSAKSVIAVIGCLREQVSEGSCTIVTIALSA